MATFTRFRLNKGPELASGLSSYRCTFNTMLAQMTRQSEHLTDEQWAAMLARLLTQWFAFEQHLLTPDSDSLIKILTERGLLPCTNQP